METHVERFAAMGTRVELHVFGAVDPDLPWQARQAVMAVDDALTIHRPSPTTALNARLGDGVVAVIDDPILRDAIIQADAANRSTGGLFDPAVGRGGWRHLAIDADGEIVRAAVPATLDFGGFGKGYALDRASRVLRDAGVRSAFLSAGESSVAVLGAHPLGGTWPLAVPHPRDPDRTLVELALEDAALSISSTLGGAPGRAASLHPAAGAVTAPRTAVVVHASGAAAEALSTALLVANPDERARRLSAPDRYVFDLAGENPIR